MMDLQTKGKKIAYLGLFICSALICSYVEFLIPFDFGIPGIKLGLANLTIIIVLYLIGIKEAILVNFVRVALAAILFTNPFAFIYSLSGAFLSLCIMAILKKYSKLSLIGVSISGGIFHNIGQILVAVMIVNQINVLYYTGILLISGTITGLLIGVVSLPICNRLETYVR